MTIALNILPVIYLDLWEVLDLQFSLIYLQLNPDLVWFIFITLSLILKHWRRIRLLPAAKPPPGKTSIKAAMEWSWDRQQWLTNEVKAQVKWGGGWCSVFWVLQDMREDEFLQDSPHFALLWLQEGEQGRQTEIRWTLLAKTSWAGFKQSHASYFTVIRRYRHINWVFCYNPSLQPPGFSAAQEGLTPSLPLGHSLVASAAVSLRGSSDGVTWLFTGLRWEMERDYHFNSTRQTAYFSFQFSIFSISEYWISWTKDSILNFYPFWEFFSKNSPLPLPFRNRCFSSANWPQSPFLCHLKLN